MKLYAISDLHLDYRTNREALEELPSFSEDWLITGGDLCTRLEHLHEALALFTRKFARVFWVPGNHELWSCPIPGDPEKKQIHGEEKYNKMIEICREFDVLTPEDPFISWPDPERPFVIAPMFIPYDYSFRPDDVPAEEAVNWAMEAGLLCRDEKLINPAPHASMVDWCAARLGYTRNRLDALDPEKELVMINHFPMRQDLVRLWRIPRFSIWCGTRETEAFHQTYPTRVVISGHLHMRATDYRDGVRFEEVSLGYPRDWDQGKGMAYYLREILPGPRRVVQGDEGPYWRFR